MKRVDYDYSNKIKRIPPRIPPKNCWATCRHKGDPNESCMGCHKKDYQPDYQTLEKEISDTNELLTELGISEGVILPEGLEALSIAERVKLLVKQLKSNELNEAASRFLVAYRANTLDNDYVTDLERALLIPSPQFTQSLINAK